MQRFVDVMDMQEARLASVPYVTGLELCREREAEAILDENIYPVATALGIFRYFVDSTRPDTAMPWRHWHNLRPNRRCATGVSSKWFLSTFEAL